MRSLLVDPTLDIGPAIAEVSADAEAGTFSSSVPPGIQGRHRHLQMCGELLGREKAVELAHCSILERNPFNPWSFRYQDAFQESGFDRRGVGQVGVISEQHKQGSSGHCDWVERVLERVSATLLKG